MTEKLGVRSILTRVFGSRVESERDRIEAETRLAVDTFMAGIANHDMAKIEEIISPHVDWFEPGNVPWAGRLTTNTEIHKFFDRLGENIVPAEHVSENSTLVVSGEDAIAFNTATQMYKRTGRKSKSEMALHIKVRGQKIVYVHFYEDTLKISRAYGLTPDV